MNDPPARATAPSPRASRAARAETHGPALVALATFALHAACWGRYGIFRDELYFLACGFRLEAGYVDQPPGIALVARLAWELFGPWVPGLRLLPWLAAAGTAWLAGRLAARLGGGAGGALLAAVAAGTSPFLLALGHYLTMNAFEVLLVTALALVLLRLVQGGDERLWIAAGGLAGLGVLFKYTAALSSLALVAGLAATPEGRRALRTRWALGGAAVGALAVLPNLAWQVAHGLPFLELVRNGQLHKNAPSTAADFALQLLRDGNPLAAPLWLAGLAAPFLLPRLRAARFLALGGGLYLAFLAASQGKGYYGAPALPLLLGAGGAALGPLLAHPAARGAVAGAVAALGVAAAPLVVPLLPEEATVAWQARLGLARHQLERSRLGALEQLLADQHGWPELARAAAAAYAALPPGERATAAVFGHNYGEAAAVEVWGRALRLELPPVVSGHNQYWLWGVPPGRGDPLIVVGDEREDCGGFYREKVRVGRLPSSPWVMPYEDARTIWICRGLAVPRERLWARVKLFI